MDIQRIDSAEGNVAKFVYTLPDAVFESVLYRYPEYKTRTVICCSTMSGCPVGCRFCGAGDHFVRSATADEIIEQVTHSIGATGELAQDIERLQVMFMSMGEPLLNKKGLTEACERLYKIMPNAALLISTIGPDIDYEWVYELSERIPTIGLQFSVHEAYNAARDRLIPFQAKLMLPQIAERGERWQSRTGRKPFFNYCAADHNSDASDADKLLSCFDPSVWEATVSVICERNEGLPARNEHQRQLAVDFSGLLLERGYNVRVFDPAGQDDIGGGCGQLWFVQRWMQENPDKARPSIGNGRPVVGAPRLPA